MANTPPPGSPAPVPRESRKGKAKQTGGTDFFEIEELLEFQLQGPQKVQRYLVKWRNEAEPTWENADGICAVHIYSFWSKLFTAKAQYEGRRTTAARSRPTKQMQKNLASAILWESLKEDGIALELGVDADLNLRDFIRKSKSRVNAMWKNPFEVDADEGDDDVGEEEERIEEEDVRMDQEVVRMEQDGEVEEDVDILEL